MAKVTTRHHGDHLLATLAGLEAMHKEMNRQIVEYDRSNELNIDAIILWQLHTQLGFGKKRLKRFYDNFVPEYNRMIDQYEGNKTRLDGCLSLLDGIGVDLRTWHDEKKGELK